MPIQYCHIGFLDRTGLKLPGEICIGRPVKRQQHNSGCTKIQSVDHGGGGKLLNEAKMHGILIQWVFAGQTQQPTWFVDQQDKLILKQYFNLLQTNGRYKAVNQGVHIKPAIAFEKPQKHVRVQAHSYNDCMCTVFDSVF